MRCLVDVGAGTPVLAPAAPRDLYPWMTVSTSVAYPPLVDNAAEIVQAYWDAANDRNWPAFGDLVADHVVYEGPQARERVRGREAYLRFNVEGFPGDWHLEVMRIVGEGRHAASWIQMTYADGTVQPGVCFFDLDDGGRITHIIDFWPEPYALPAQRERLVERY